MRKERKHRIAAQIYKKVKKKKKKFQPSSFLGMVAVKEKVADRWRSRGEADGERPFLQQSLLE